MVRDGIPYVVFPGLLALAFIIGTFVWIPLLWIPALALLALTGFMAFFFRDPRRSIPLEPGVIVAPADGKVTIARPADGQNAESLVSIFLSPFDVHINRSPIAGENVDMSHKTGKYVMPTREDAR